MNQPVQIDPPADTVSSNGSDTNKPVGGKRRQRKTLFAMLALLVAAASAGGWTYWKLVASHYVETDDAYTAADSAQVASAITGTVAEVRVKDTQFVKKGQILVVIDPADAKLAVAQAQEELDRAVRHVKSLYANNDGLDAQVAAHNEEVNRARAQLSSAQADLKRATIDLKRRQALASSGSISGEELTQAQNAYASAQANVRAMKAAVSQAIASRKAALGAKQANAALIHGVSVDANPEVALARTRLDQAELDLERTIIRSPIDGVIARRQVQLGQRVQPSTFLLSVVPVQHIYVDANFKESQLNAVRPGQKVTLVSDLYGSDVVFHGVVEGFSGGTGSAFSLIPAQNATGNWIKVVQRLPVRIQLAPAELKTHPLRVGLTMTATVDLHGKS